MWLFDIVLRNVSTFGWSEQLKKTVFSKWPMPMVIKSHMIKDPLTEQDRWMNFYITDYEKFVNIVSDSILQLIFKKLLPPIKFWCNSKEEYS